MSQESLETENSLGLIFCSTFMLCNSGLGCFCAVIAGMVKKETWISDFLNSSCVKCVVVVQEMLGSALFRYLGSSEKLITKIGMCVHVCFSRHSTVNTTEELSHDFINIFIIFQIASALQLCAGRRVSSRGGPLHAAAPKGRLWCRAGHPHLADGGGQFRRRPGHHWVHRLPGDGLCNR